MNWSKRQIQMYGIFLAALGFLLGVSVSHDLHPHFQMKEVLPFIFVVLPFSVIALGLVAIFVKIVYKIIKEIYT
jgi:energy-converting hydrogenase Eha subunit A